MPNRPSRVQNEQYSVGGEGKASLLLRALNNELGPGAKNRKDVVDRRALLLLMKRFQRLEQATESQRTLPLTRRDPESPEMLRHYTGLNRALRRYEAIPGVHPLSLYDPDAKVLGWDFVWGRTGRSQPFMELNLVLLIAAFAAAGTIASFKQCDACQRWLQAKFAHQRFCSSVCKEEFHRSNPQDKARRREWARNNYQLHKTKNVK